MILRNRCVLGTGSTALVAASIAALCVFASCQSGPTPNPSETQQNKSAGTSNATAKAAKPEAPAAEFLRETAQRYASAKTYRDAGRCTNEFTVSGSDFVDTKVFKTAFERDKRFRYELHHSRAPGGDPVQTLIAWSPDFKAFEWMWSYRSLHRTEASLKDELMRPNALSGGATRVAFPLLSTDTGLDSLIDTQSPADLGHEAAGGTDCRKFEGKLAKGETVTLWIDKDHLIRKVHMIQPPDPSLKPEEPGKPAPMLATVTMVSTIVFDRVSIDDVIPDWAFEPPRAPPMEAPETGATSIPPSSAPPPH